MTLVERVYIRCDVCGRMEPFWNDEQMESLGWRRVDPGKLSAKDICPDHREDLPPRSGPQSPTHVL